MTDLEADKIENAWLDGGSGNATLDYIPIEHFGVVNGMFVALVRVTDDEEKSSLSMIVGPCGKDCAHEVTTLPDTKEGIAIARTIAPIVLRTIFLNDQRHGGACGRPEPA